MVECDLFKYDFVTWGTEEKPLLNMLKFYMLHEGCTAVPQYRMVGLTIEN